MRLLLLVVLLCLVVPAHADPYTVSKERVRQVEFDLVALHELDPGEGGLENACGSAPLPLTPTGPTAVGEWQYSPLYGDRTRVTAWRIPCSPSGSMIALTLEPIQNGNQAFICGPRILLMQTGGLQTDVFWLRNDPPTTSSFCGPVLAPVTVALMPRTTTPASFDFDQAMSIVYQGGGSNPVVQPLAITAFDPSQYGLTPTPGPHSVEVHVQGSGAHYRNCSVTQASQGGGTQYTASCNSETSLVRRQFEQLDY